MQVVNIIAVTVLATAAWGQGIGSFPARPPADPAAVARGKTSYGANCAYCHAEDARGGENGGANLLRSDAVMRDKFGEEIGRFLQTANTNEHKFRLSRAILQPTPRRNPLKPGNLPSPSSDSDSSTPASGSAPTARMQRAFHSSNLFHLW